MGPFGHFQPRNEKKRKQIVRFSVKTYHREYPLVIFNPEMKKNGSRLSVFQSKHTYGVPFGHFQPRNEKKRKQIVRFSVKTYHREYTLVIFNPKMKKNGSRLSDFQSKHTIGSTLWSFSTQKKKNGSRLSVFQSKHTIGSTLWSFSTQKFKKTEADCPFFSQNIP